MKVNLPGTFPTRKKFIFHKSQQLFPVFFVFARLSTLSVFYFNYFSFVHLIAFNSPKSLRQPFHLWNWSIPCASLVRLVFGVNQKYI